MAIHASSTPAPVVQPDLLPAITAVTTSIKSTLDRMCAEATEAVLAALTPHAGAKVQSFQHETIEDPLLPAEVCATVAQIPCQPDTGIGDQVRSTAKQTPTVRHGGAPVSSQLAKKLHRLDHPKFGASTSKVLLKSEDNDLRPLSSPAPLPSLTAAFSRRRAIFGAVRGLNHRKLRRLKNQSALAPFDLALAQVRHARRALDGALEQPIEQTFRSEGAGLSHADFADVTDLASLDLARLRHARRMASDAIDHLIALLDALDAPDEDREPVGDEEPSLGWQEGSGAANGAVEDLEEDTADHEFCLGWNETVSQLALGRASDDGDDTALERAGRGFIRSGHDDAEDDDPAERDDEHGSDDGEDIGHFASDARFTLQPLTEAQREEIAVLAHRATTVRRVAHV